MVMMLFHLIAVVAGVMGVILGTGCQVVLGIHDPEPRERGAVAATCDEIATPDDGCLQWSPTHFGACDICVPSGPLALDMPGTYLYDTDEGSLSDPDGATIAHAGVVWSQVDVEAWLISLEQLTIAEDATLRVVGGRPLIVASWSDIAVDGTIDVSSRREDGRSGAGANRACERGQGTAGAAGGSTGGGGGGGAFQGAGGRGTRGGGTGSDPSEGGVRGEPISIPDIVRGGCPGADGGPITVGDLAGGAGGDGGGAIQLSVRQSLVIAGRILANGSGGGAGAFNQSSNGSGGGGGGSGGYIGLEGRTVRVMGAVVTANGGGGGEGGDFDEAGNPGSDGLTSDQPALGGTAGASSGVDGGLGGSRDNLDGLPSFMEQSGGGGGGGGGVGYIVTFSELPIDNNSIVSPDWDDVGSN